MTPLPLRQDVRLLVPETISAAPQEHPKHQSGIPDTATAKARPGISCMVGSLRLSVEHDVHDQQLKQPLGLGRCKDLPSAPFAACPAFL
eukprot:1718586-Amphidinium_carterae.1